ncbi:type IV toxin-antitoxin system AbiEi family antitoxin domain-containing protein [Frankia nepalensis]|uniref:Type IV toxin-antitoxin system AbiEi family antitoxin domain-containing protein n=1 Tax=Frankia nepalensis TaxID=1836974 RepID=A0A937RP97_9ACTN|nr:type IV toxin-antitoxin system AbiEi family antitoxin domain-containing protein [Frankia nepalensis]MBL7630128.1 type IV toxin-antitoxin system AbiEi family antitoxin domain-containing protein [Frankia nepalensis]
MGLDALPAVFRLDQAAAAGLSRQTISRLHAAGDLDQLGRGVYAQPGAVDPALASLAGAATRQPRATLCLGSALARHGLSDDLPSYQDVALPRHARPPAGFSHVAWHHFAPETFDIGRVALSIGGVDAAIYSPERTIVDVFRLSYREGEDTAVEALKRWLRQPGNHPSGLLTIAGHFPATLRRLRRILEILV